MICVSECQSTGIFLTLFVIENLSVFLFKKGYVWDNWSVFLGEARIADDMCMCVVPAS